MQKSKLRFTASKASDFTVSNASDFTASNASDFTLRTQVSKFNLRAVADDAFFIKTLPGMNSGEGRFSKRGQRALDHLSSRAA